MQLKWPHQYYWLDSKSPVRTALSAVLVAIFSLLTPLDTGAPLYAAQNLGGIEMTEVVPRIITPNGDLLNDVIFFKFNNSLTGIPIESQIMDINGANVSTLNYDTNQTSLTWDGKDASGQNVPSGIYVYIIKIGESKASGTVVVAR